LEVINNATPPKYIISCDHSNKISQNVWALPSYQLINMYHLSTPVSLFNVLAYMVLNCHIVSLFHIYSEITALEVKLPFPVNGSRIKLSYNTASKKRPTFGLL